MSNRRRLMAVRTGCALLFASFFARPVLAQTVAPPLAHLQFDIVGVRLVVDPPALTVPKNIATQINTSLVTPPDLGAEIRDAIATLTDGAQIEAELRGPSLSPTRIAVVPGQPLPIPPLAVPGDYVLDGIRLVKDGQTILDATTAGGAPATIIPIRVINEVFVASVTSKPLSLDEIRGKGIVIDDKNFSVVNFQVAFNIDGTPFTISAPAAMPTPELLKTGADRTVLVQQISALNRQLAGALTTLPPQFDRPGLNFSIAALPFFPVISGDGGDRGFDTPPITGLIVIPGNVAFLNQFFSSLLIVANVAPDGTPLELRNVSATIALPKGLDGVAGTFDAPGDDPLRLARIQGLGVQPTIVIAQRGPDGQLGTADDVVVIPPQKQGEGEFLIEGLKEGSQQFDIAINATLFGLPSGPVDLEGKAAGSVFVRNPTFAVSLAHPRTVRSGEPYAIYATVTNTSRTPANLVSVNLDPRAISGAQLLSDSTVTFSSIAPGESAVAKYSMRAQLTGQVTFASFTGDAALGGGIRLVTGVDERDVPLSANAIVLPQSTTFLPASLVEAAQRVLGQAFSVATAPAEALPEGVLFVKRQTVIDRGVELAEAGERVKFGEPFARVIQDLLLDWVGNSGVEAGFDQIMRTTGAGTAMLNELSAVIGPAAMQTGALEYQRQFANAAVSRAAHLSAIASSTGGSVAPLLTVVRASGGAVGTDGEGGAISSLPSAGLLTLADSSGTGGFAIVAHPEIDRYAIELVAPASGLFDLGVVVPGAGDGQLRQLQFAGIALDAGGIARVEVDLTSGSATTLAIDRDGDGVADSQKAAATVDVVAGPPQLLAVRQLESSARDASAALNDPAAYGLLVGALFDEPVTETSAELTAHYTIPSNAVIGAQLQHGGRLVYLYLQKPIGGLVARSLGVSGIVDARGAILSTATRPITTILGDGAHVSGQVRDAGGVPVGGGLLTLTVTSAIGPTSFNVSAFNTDAGGGFDFDFVPRIGDQFTLTAQHPITRDLATITARVRAAGDQMLLNPTFLGRGTVRGRVVAPDGVASVPNVPIALLPGSVLGLRGFQGRTNALGEFTFTDVPVGVFTLSAADGLGGFGQATGLIARGGDVVAQDLRLVTQPDAGGQLMGRVFLSDGSTPGAAFTVYVGRYHRDNGTIDAIDQTQTDAAGTFVFAQSLPAASYDVVAVDPATQQLGAVTTNVIARTTNSVSIVLESVGAVEGVVFNGRGERVAGALVAGGIALATTDANGFFHIDGVPAGQRRIEAGDPVTRRRGSAAVTVLPGLTASAAITLESRATITGRVLDANGSPVPGASVRIPAIDGYTFVIANSHGVFTFPDMPLGDYLIQAPGPSKESLISFMQANGIDPASAFTSGDAPDGASLSTPSAGDANAVLAAYQQAVQTFFSVDPSLLTGLPMASTGGFGWNSVKLFQDSTTVVADIKFLSQGTVSGHTVDAAGRATGAAVRVSSLTVTTTGFPGFIELSRLNTDPASGAFSFGGVAVFDLATFQTAGVRAGDFTLEAANPFSPAHPQFRGQLSTATPNLANIVLAFPGAVDTSGTVSGRVLQPDGVTPAPAGTSVAISFGDLTVTTDADGRFHSVLPIPAGNYLVTAIVPNGLRGQTIAVVEPGRNVDLELRLLGLGAVTVTVARSNGAPVANAEVKLLRASFPGDTASGVTDAQGSVRFVGITEGAFSATAEEAVTGLSGRASAAIIRDGELVLPIVIAASGTVTGTFLSATDGTPIAFAQIVLTSGGVQAYASTDAGGRFALTAIPVGTFNLEGFDPLTNRRGRATGTLHGEGDLVDVTIFEAPRGTVTGFVVNADGVTPVAASRVSLSASTVVETRLQATALPDGSFRFEGVPAGAFALEATDPVSGFGGSASGSVTFEGEIVQKNVVLAPFGSARITVLDAAGQPAPNASVTVGGRQAATDPNGQFTFENLALGTYQVVARSLADANNGGIDSVTIASFGQTADATVRLRGVGGLAVTVLASDGVSVVPSAAVTVNAQASSAGSIAGPLATTLNGFTNAAGVATFPSVPIGDVSVRAEAAALAGVASGTVAAGANAQVQVRLGASGSVVGRLLLPDGVTPAARTFVTLRFQSQSALQSGVLQITTDLTGAFEFRGIPLGSFQLSAIEVVTSGVRAASGSIIGDGQRVDLGTLTLENTGPRVVTVSPADRTGNVAARGPIVMTFSAPLARGSIRASGPTANVALFEGSTAVPLADPEFSADGTTITLRPARDLISGVLETVTVKGAPDGPASESGLVMPEPFVSTFTVRDTTPPVVVAISPAPGANQVPPDATVRITFSEPVIGATLSLRDASSALVPGTVALTAGGTAAIFTPAEFLHANTTYTLTMSGIADLAGNPLPGGTSSATFATIDTAAPAIAALQLIGTPRAGRTISVHPTIADTDVQRVEYTLGSSFLGAVTEPPFDRSLTLPIDTPSVSVTAVAFDLVGNRSSAFTLPIAIQPTSPPSVTLKNLGTATTVSQNQTVSFEVSAAGDGQLAQVFFTAVGSATASIVVPITPGQTGFTQTFSVTVPAGAPSNSTITIQAAAIDTSGSRSTPASLVLTVRDAIKPTLTVLSPVNNALVLVGASVDVVVDAADDVALASVALVCNPSLSGCETRTFTPAVGSSRQTFTVLVPADLQAPAVVTLSLVAADASGNTTTSGRVLQIADTIRPQVTSLVSASGSNRVAAGDTATLRATVSDNVGVTALTFAVEGGFVASGTLTVSPPLTSGVVPLSIPVPASVANGAALTVRVRSRDAANNSSDEEVLLLTVGDSAAPTLTILEPADGALVSPGGTVTLRVHATDDVAVRRFTVTASGAVSFSETRDVTPSATPADAVFVIPVPAGAPAGAVLLTAEAFDTGGNSSGTVTRSIAVADTVSPQVQITSPAAGVSLDPRQPISVTVSATDAVGVTAISLAASGAVSSFQSRAVSPAATSRAETFNVSVSPIPATGGSLTLNATARDAAGNLGTAVPATIQLLDVVAPDVASVVPGDGATAVDPLSLMVVRFSEPMGRATLNATSIQLMQGSTIVPVTLAIGAADDVVTLTPVTRPLAFGTKYTVVVSTAASDRAGNALSAARAFTFTTASRNRTPPSVASTNPANNAVDVSLVSPIEVTFTQAIDPSTITSSSFRVRIGTSAVGGTFSFLSGNTIVRFTPADALPVDTAIIAELTSAITDPFGDALVAADGSPLSSPVTFTFATGRFNLTNPSGAEIVENSQLLLEARASVALGVSTVIFTVNGQDLPPVSGPPFTRAFAVGPAAVTPTLTIAASARNSGGVEVARDTRSVNVVVGLTVAPSLSGVPLGRSGVLTFRVSTPLAIDLPIALSAGDSTSVGLPASPVILGAGQTSLAVPIAGLQTGATAVIGTSSHGSAAAIVAVSPVQAGHTLSPSAPLAGAAISNPPTAGVVFAASGSLRTVRVAVLGKPAAANTSVSVTSTNTAVATATAGTIQAGQQTVDVTITAIADGVTTIVIRVGDELRGLTVYVGAQPPNAAPLLMAPPVGVAISNPPNAGQVIAAAGRQISFTLPLLTAPATVDTPVSVSSDNSSVATAANAIVRAGSTSATITVTTIADGRATLIVRVGDLLRAVTILVGTPAAGSTPALLASPVGVSVTALPTLGRAFAPLGVLRSLGIKVLESPAAVDTPVSVTTSDATVATVSPGATVRAGQRLVNLEIVTGAAGTATLTIDVGGVRRELTVVVGSDPTPGTTPPVVAAPVGVTVIPNPSIGRVFGTPGTASSATLGVPLLNVPAPAAVLATVTSSNVAIVTVGGGATTTISIGAGERLLQLPIAISGAQGAALITIEYNGQRRELVIVVGNPPASEIPAVTAPIVGVRIG